MAAALRAIGLAYRLNVRDLRGAPDFANRRRQWAVFVYGCFWHRHTGCHRATTPAANRAFWLEKFAANRGRKARAVRALRAMGFKVAIVWECQTGEAAARLSKILEPRRRDVPQPSGVGGIGAGPVLPLQTILLSDVRRGPALKGDGQ